MRQIRPPPRQEIIDRDDFVSLSKQSFDEMTSDETGPASNKNPHDLAIPPEPELEQVVCSTGIQPGRR